VLITQEEEPGETSAPASDDLVLNPQEGDLEARTTLDTVFLNQLETQSCQQPHDDNSKNDMDAGEQEEGMGQPEISIPMTELSANTDPLPTSPSKTKTLSTDEDQQKAESPGHTISSPARELSGPSHGTEQASTPILPHKPLTEEEGGQVPTLGRDREPTMEHLYTAGSLGNTLSWGDQQIPEPVDEVTDIQIFLMIGKGRS
jgi:hypothetical protein